ncbi:hypothetical protein [Acidipila sp. EB88]|uniref:hypothetical protein n=1 Tax=Acidipila sp. EB88 TaxID=2305226 RepID=UPI000F5DBCBB|nr:hypothetical protein [Acidipila sp. EB88]RRA49054.1 hypothetical protein D1Y84_12965 [Acidipila sp. EB88]
MRLETPLPRLFMRIPPRLARRCAFSVALVGTLLLSACFGFRANIVFAQLSCEEAAVAHPSASGASSLQILGLVSPATVSGGVTLSIAGAPAGATTYLCLDGAAFERAGSEVQHLSSRVVAPGAHQLQAVSYVGGSLSASSSMIDLIVVPTADADFSAALTAPLQSSSQPKELSTILSQTATPGDGLTPAESATRQQVAAMYLNFGYDVAADPLNDISTLLPSLIPGQWGPTLASAGAPFSMQFSGDAPYYHKIPAAWPRVPLPRGYIQSIQVNTNQGGDGIGFGIAPAQADSLPAVITSDWPGQPGTYRTIPFRIPGNWASYLPSLPAGDEHVVFVDPQLRSFVSAYKTTVDPATKFPDALYAGDPASLDSLGDYGGSVAARVAELPLLTMPGESTSDSGPILHAIGGSISRPWAGRVYPATARDYGILTSVKPCTGSGVMNTGLVPYGGVIQLDPALDLSSLGLSRPALRILTAMQTYGYYVMDYGCTDLDIYTATPESELLPYGGLYGNANGSGIQNEITTVLANNILYVVPPVTKRP